MGEVTLLEETVGDADEVAGLAARLRQALHEYARAVGAEEPEWPTDAVELSYAVGAAVGLDLGERQQLLAADDAETRLRLGLRLVRREGQLVTLLGVVPPSPEHGFNPN